jgi:hypothetical protein
LRLCLECSMTGVVLRSKWMNAWQSQQRPQTPAQLHTPVSRTRPSSCPSPQRSWRCSHHTQAHNSLLHGRKPRPVTGNVLALLCPRSEAVRAESTRRVYIAGKVLFLLDKDPAKGP